MLWYNGKDPAHVNGGRRFPSRPKQPEEASVMRDKVERDRRRFHPAAGTGWARPVLTVVLYEETAVNAGVVSDGGARS